MKVVTKEKCKKCQARRKEIREESRSVLKMLMRDAEANLGG